MMIGILLGLLTGVALGSITSFAALSYEYGANPLGVVFLRAVLALGVTFVIARITHESLRLDRKVMVHALSTGLALSLLGFAYMAAVAFITPGLAVALLYLFPLMVLAAESFIHRRTPSTRTIVAFMIALSGIIMCLGVTWATLDWRGIVLGVLAAIGVGGYLLSSSRASAAGLGLAPLVWGNGLAALLAIAVALALPGHGQQLLPPLSITGQWAMLGAAFFYVVGIVLAYYALRLASAALVALMMNLEPLTTLTAAWLLVGENLTPLQYVGMLIVVTGISLGGLSQMSKKPGR